MSGLPVRPLRVLMVLSHASYVRDFWASGLLDKLLARGHRLVVVAPHDLADRIRGDGSGGCPEAVEPLERYRAGKAREWLRGIFRTASFVQRSHFSTYCHKVRILESRPRGDLKLKGYVTYWSWALGVRVLRSLGRFVDLERWALWLEGLIRSRRAAVRLVEETRPDVVVAPTALYEAPVIEIFKAARRLGVPVLGFPSSWDTLTSKGFFLVRPDRLMVWGEETRRHAVEYHGYAADRVFVTGPAHFDMYAPAFRAEPRERFLGRRGIPLDKRVLLFVGTTVSYWADEPLQVRALSRLVEDGELKDCVVWYRPHPRRGYRDVKELKELGGLPGVHVDDQMLRLKAEGRGDYSVEPEDLLHYRSLVEASEGVITAFSTMIIEAALLGKPSLVVGFGLGDQGPQRLLEHARYEHMRDVIATPGVTLCGSMEELRAGIHRLLRGDFAPLAGALRARAERIAHCLDGRGRERIVAAIETVAGT